MPLPPLSRAQLIPGVIVPRRSYCPHPELLGLLCSMHLIILVTVCLAGGDKEEKAA